MGLGLGMGSDFDKELNCGWARNWNWNWFRFFSGLRFGMGLQLMSIICRKFCFECLHNVLSL